MANEKLLIDAKPLMENGWHLERTGKSNQYLASMSLADVPTVDAVEVVRCRECKYWVNGCCDNASFMDIGANENGFCSNGERREGE